ncbi:16S rRNA (cytidine(1402)-2'-O)-methyltransferase [Chromatiales bacterium (ex Bugula neritina AB1)]|nr:16S rRNA (cytidine(1402)-2'-O)-methyltransferase [Chromatiales bacterium (ex Bugula neritina AB1)]
MSVEKSAPKNGVFYVIATPIGNLADISARAKDVMASVSCLYAEDTRHTGALCRRLGLHARLVSLHEHNERDRIAEVIARLQSGESVGLVSDAGTPLISDPGYRIVAACHERNLPVSPIPGASSLLAALSVCGLPTDEFTFCGFLPHKRSARCKVLAELENRQTTTVFFESRHRIVESLADVENILGGGRRICVARELTKTFETILSGGVSVVLEQIQANSDWQKGEFVLVVGGGEELVTSFSPEVRSLLLDVAAEVAPRRASSIVSSHTGVDKKILYEFLVAQKNSI